jgi:predicted outer membrane repeat protein
MVIKFRLLAALLLITCFRICLSKEWYIDMNQNISAALARITSGDTLYLNSGIYSGPANCNLNILQSNIAILAYPPNSVIIDCGQISPHLKVLASNISLSGIEFRNGFTTTNGGCIAISNSASVLISNSKFLNCKAANHGGGIYISPTSTVKAISCIFFSNQASSLGGAIYADESSTVVLDGNLTEFEQNTASSSIQGVNKRGGAIYLYHNSTLTSYGRVVLTRNTAFMRGGAIYAQGATVNFFGPTVFHSNLASENGGAVYAVSPIGFPFTLSFSFFAEAVFISNGVDLKFPVGGSGGAICVLGRAGRPATLRFASGVVMENNSALWGGGLQSGNFANVIVEGTCVFRFNNATYGGAMYVLGISSSIYMALAELVGNSASYRGGAVYLSDGNATIRGRLRSNVAQAGGGVALYGAARVNLSEILLEDNHALAGPESSTACKLSDPCGGGALFLTDQAQCHLGPAADLIHNRAASGDGGAILLSGAAKLMTSWSRLANNSAHLRGGGAAVLGQSVLEIKSTKFDGNSAGSEGGAIFSEGQGVIAESTSFSNNSAVERGGALSLYSPVQLLMDLRFRNNSAQIQGGAIFASGYFAQISVGINGSIEFLSNVAGLDGGAVALEDSAAFSVEFEACPSSCLAARRGNGICERAW